MPERACINDREIFVYHKFMSALVLLTFFLAGCSVIPMAPAGRAPSQEEASALILAKFNAGYLKDPYSVQQFRITGGPRLVSWNPGFALRRQYEQAWIVCFQYNARTSAGGYAGLTQDAFMIRRIESIPDDWDDDQKREAFYGYPAGTLFIVPSVRWERIPERC